MRIRRVATPLGGLIAVVSSNLSCAASIPPEQVLLDGPVMSGYAHALAIDGNRMVISGGGLHVYARAGRFWVREARIAAPAPSNPVGPRAYVGLAGDRIVSSIGNGALVFQRVGTAWVQDAQITIPGLLVAPPVSISGTTIAIGTDEIVHVYVRGAASWTLQQQLTHALGNAACGTSVAAFGDRIVSGCPSARIAAQNTGAALVYRRDGTSWSPEATLAPSDGLADRRFGAAVALTDTDVAVGAPASDDSIIGATARPGAVYTYTRSGTSWSPGARLVPAASANGDSFGFVVSIMGDRLVAGAPYLRLIGDPPIVAGAAHVFERNAALWTERAMLVNGTGAVGDYFGTAVATGDDAYVAGAYRSAEDGNPSGAAFHYTEAALDGSSGTSTEGGADDQRGSSVATAGNFLIVGAPNVEAGASTDQGAVTVYEKVAGVYTLKQTLIASDGRIGDKFGTSVATNDSGSVIVIGAPGIDVGSNLDVGTGYVFERPGSSWVQVARLPDVGLGSNARAGASIALSNDGTTVFIGAPNRDQARGTVLRFTRTGAPPAAKGLGPWQITALIGRPSGGSIGDKWGAAIALEGTQLAIGAPGAANTAGDAHHGLAQVLKPSGNVMVAHTPEIRDAGLAGPDQTRFGTSVAFDGTDLAVGAPDTDVASGATINPDQGAVETYRVESTGAVTPQQTVRADNGTIGDKFGAALAADGGVLVIGAPLAPSGPDGQGIAYVFRPTRPAGGLVRWSEDQQISVAPSNPDAGDAFGHAVAIRAGTIAIGAPRRDFPEAGPKGGALVRDVGAAFAMPYVANVVFRDGFE